MSLSTFIAQERSFLKQLSQNERSLLGSFFFWALSKPFHSVFINTYLWRASQDPVVLFTYNAAFFAGVAVGFVANTVTTRFVSVRSALIFGSLLQCILPAILIAFGLTASAAIIPVGLAMGIAEGIYWANRNYLTSKATDGGHRMSYLSVEYVLSSIANIFSPLALGWFLALGGLTGWYSVDLAYQCSAVISIVLLLLSIGYARKMTIGAKGLNVRNWFVRSASPAWNRFRLFALCDGVIYGAEAAIPLILILQFLGQEEAVGTIGAVTATLSTLALYVVGRQINNHTNVFAAWLIFSLVGTVAIAIGFNAWSVVLYMILRGIVGPFRGSSLAALLFESVKREAKNSESKRATYIIDRELVLNVGRLIILVPFVFAGASLAEPILRYGLFLVIIAQVIMITLVPRQTKIPS